MAEKIRAQFEKRPIMYVVTAIVTAMLGGGAGYLGVNQSLENRILVIESRQIDQDKSIALHGQEFELTVKPVLDTVKEIEKKVDRILLVLEKENR